MVSNQRNEVASRLRPAEFTCYASRMAWNLLANMAPPHDITGYGLDPETAQVLPQAFADLRAFMVALYRDLYEHPAAWRLPLRALQAGDGREQITAPRTKMEPYLRALWALGQLGEEKDGHITVNGEAWRAWLAANKSKVVAVFLAGLTHMGLELHGENTLEVVSPRFPRMPLALSLLSKATIKDKKAGFWHFCRGDMRALGNDFAWTLEDALTSAEERDANVARRLDAFVRDLGCRMELLPPTLWWGEYRARYTHRQTGKALYGFVVQEGSFSIRAICDNTKDILPTVLKQPQPVREWFLEGCSCRNCGYCNNPTKLEQDGRLWRLCAGAYAGDRTPPYEHIASVEQIISAQLDLIKGRRATKKDPQS
jgi:hypothetical protein